MIGRMQPVAQYKTVREVGGGYWLAEDPAAGREVWLRRWEGTAAGAVLVNSRAVAMLRHPNIGVVYEAIEQDGGVWVASEPRPGETLAGLMATGRVETRRALEIIREVAAALDFAHSREVVHRHLTPEKVVLVSTGHAKVVDFGCPVEGGGLLWKPPEPTEMAGPRGDQYSLAVIAFELLTGLHPFPDGEAPQGDAIPVLASQVNPQLGKKVDAVFRRALALRPGARYETCSAFAGELWTRLRKTAGQEDEEVFEGGEPRARWARVAMMAGIVVAIGAAAAVGGWWWMGQDKGEQSRTQEAVPVVPENRPPVVAAPETIEIPRDEQAPKEVAAGEAMRSGSGIELRETPALPERVPEQTKPAPRPRDEMLPPVRKAPPVGKEVVPPKAGGRLTELAGQLEVFIRRQVRQEDGTFTVENQPLTNGLVIEPGDRPVKGELLWRLKSEQKVGVGAGVEVRWLRNGELNDIQEVRQERGTGKLAAYGNKGDPGQYEVQLLVDGKVKQKIEFTIR